MKKAKDESRISSRDTVALVRRMIQEIEAHAPQVVALLKLRAVERLGELVNSEDQQVALKASQTLLENDPFPARQVAAPDDPLLSVLKTYEEIAALEATRLGSKTARAE